MNYDQKVGEFKLYIQYIKMILWRMTTNFFPLKKISVPSGTEY